MTEEVPLPVYGPGHYVLTDEFGSTHMALGDALYAGEDDDELYLKRGGKTVIWLRECRAIEYCPLCEQVRIVSEMPTEADE